MIVIVCILAYLCIRWARQTGGFTPPGWTPNESPQNEWTPGILHVVLSDPGDVATTWCSEIFFEPGDPRDWSDYKGQARVKELVQLQLDVLEPDDGVKFLFIAPKGSGKTTLFRIIGNKLLNKRPGRYIEITPAMLKTKQKLDQLMGDLHQGDCLCIDEIHMFPRQIADTLLPAIEDGVFPFDNGMRRLPTGISWIGATTDVGLLPEAFRDRFQILSLGVLEPELLAQILQDQPFPITHEAALQIAHRSVGSPRELKRIYRLARDVCKVSGSSCITAEQTARAFGLLDLDPNGLYPNDRNVLEALFQNPKFYAPRADGSRLKRYAHSERAIRALTGLDESLYRDEVEPKLLRLQFLTIGSAGRELTDKAFSHYFQEH